MPALLAYLFYFVAASASPIQRRFLAQRHNGDVAAQIRFAFQVICFPATIGLLVLPLFHPFQIQGNPFSLLVFAISAGIAGSASFGLFFVTQKHVEAGIGTLASNVYTPVTIVLSSLFLQEGLTWTQGLGTVLLLIGVIVVSKKHRLGRFAFDRYFMLTLLSGILIGICLVAERALQKETGFTTGTLLSWWMQAACLGITAWFMRGKTVFSRSDLLVTGILRFGQAISWVTLVNTVGNLSLVSAVTTFKVVTVFIGAAIFLKEREDMPRKLLGSLIAIAGLLMMD